MDGLYKGRVVSIGSLDAAARIGVLTGDTFADGDDVVLAQGVWLSVLQLHVPAPLHLE